MIKLPSEFADIEREVNREIRALRDEIDKLKRVQVFKGEGRLPVGSEREMGIYRDPDSTTKKLVLRDEGKNYTVSLTEVT